MIPVMVKFDRQTFDRLEKIAGERGTDVRTLITWHVRASLNPAPYRRVMTRNGKPVSESDIDAWVQAARMGVTNEVIAQRWGVTRQLVSRCLIDRGVRRQRPHTDQANRSHGG